MVYVKFSLIQGFSFSFLGYRCKYSNGSLFPLMRISRTDDAPRFPPPPLDDRQGTIMDDNELGDDEEDSDFDPDSYNSSSESDDTYYDSSSDDDSNSEADLELEGDLDGDRIYTGKTKGTRTDGDLSLGPNVSYEDYPGVPQKAVAGPVVAAVFSTSALFILGGVIYLYIKDRVI